MSIDLRYAYDKELSFTRDVSPFAGGWANQYSSQPIDFSAASTPPYVHPLNAAPDVVIHRPLDLSYNDTDSPGTVYTFDKIRIRYYRSAAGDIIHASLRRVARDGSGGVVEVDSWSSSGGELSTVGSWALYSGSVLALALDPDTYYYYLRVYLRSATNPPDARIADLGYTLLKAAVE